MSNPNMKRGARPTPAHRILAATPFRARIAAPLQFAVVPPHLDLWGNRDYGDCVTAEEAFAKAAYSIQCGLPEVFIAPADVIDWATRHGVLNGAFLDDVMKKMAIDGLPANGQVYTDGGYQSVNISDESVLQNAISQGPVKIGIDAGGLPSTAGHQQGWYSVSTATCGTEDHCVSLCGYGPAQWLYQQLGVTLPSGLPATTPGYLLFTWGTIGFVTHGWLMGCCQEAWLRLPTTIGQTPQPPSTPPYKLYEGTMNSPQPVGSAQGYPSLSAAEAAAQGIADQDKAAVMIHDSTGVMVETISPTPVVPPTFTISVPQQPVYVTGPLGGTLSGYMPAFTVTGTVNPPTAASASLPPFVKIILQLLCTEAPLLPEPYKTAIMAVCALLPPSERSCKH